MKRNIRSVTPILAISFLEVTAFSYEGNSSWPVGGVRFFCQSEKCCDRGLLAGELVVSEQIR